MAAAVLAAAVAAPPQITEDAEARLLALLRTEIARDGGVTPTALLKDYLAVPRRLDALLLRSVGSRRLLQFLERHPTVFAVDRSTPAHVARLLAVAPGDAPPPPPSDADIAARRDAIRERVCYVLRKRNHRIARRQRPGDTRLVSGEWLLRQCRIPVHLCLRLTGFYARAYASPDQVRVIGSPEWEELVLPEFRRLIRDWVSVTAAGKVFLAEEDEDASDGSHSEAAAVAELAHRLAAAVDRDGATRIALSLLLHRDPALRGLLGGRDLPRLVEDHADCFRDRVVVHVDERRQVYLQSAAPQPRADRRMAVDETGLFSLAASRWSTAMANALAFHCRTTLGTDPAATVALDLTASVGGVSLGLARVFARVVAIEIDPHRAGLCRQNMRKHGVDRTVEVRNVDAVRELEALPPRSVVFLDPPWGGHDYKRGHKPLVMGPWSFQYVLEKVGQTLSPCVCGMRLPITFPVDSLLTGITERGISVEVLRNKRMGPQQFLVLSF